MHRLFVHAAKFTNVTLKYVHPGVVCDNYLNPWVPVRDTKSSSSTHLVTGDNKLIYINFCSWFQAEHLIHERWLTNLRDQCFDLADAFVDFFMPMPLALVRFLIVLSDK